MGEEKEGDWYPPHLKSPPNFSAMVVPMNGTVTLSSYSGNALLFWWDT